MRKGGIGIFGFAVLVFIAVYGFSVFSIWFSVLGFDIRCRFRFFLFDLFWFRFLFNLSGNHAPPLISNSS